MGDYYLNEDNCNKRLLEDYYKYNTLILAVDFDNTIYDFFNKWLEFNDVLKLLKRAVALNMKIVIYTASVEYEKIEKYCERIGLKIEGINKNLLKEFENSGKIYYNLLLDDRAGLPSAYNQLLFVVEKLEQKEEIKWYF